VAVDVLAWLWKVNVFLAAFNLIPAAPLDGGRVLRAGLWWRWRDRTRAAVAAARAGRVFGIVLIVVGVVGVFYEGLLGLWPALIGMFVYAMARAEENYAGMRAELAHLRVADVMTPHPPVVPIRTTVAELVDRHLGWYRGDAVVVTDAAGYLAGVVTSHAVGHVPIDRRATTAVGDIALPLPVLPVAWTGEAMGPVLERMAAAEGRPALVLDDDRRLAGVITTGDVARAAFQQGGMHHDPPRGDAGWQQSQGTRRF
jgi:CBS domain-containing protein